MARWPWGSVLLLCACPQLLDDDFETLAADLDGIGAPSGSGGALSLGLDAGALQGTGGRGVGGTSDTAGSAGVSGAGGSASEPDIAGSCTDLVQNENEQGVDCGGLCPACPCAFGSFSAPELLEGLDVAGDRHGPSLSPDGLTLYFSAEGATSEDVFVASRANVEAAFSAARPLVAVNSQALDGSPSLTSDGTTLFLFSDRPGGPGNRDIWVATADDATGAFGAPSLIPNINSAEMDLLPELSHDRKTLLFVSLRPGGSGETDIWAAEREAPTSDFAEPANRGDLSSADRDEGHALSRDGLSILLSSTRGGSSDMNLWLASRPDTGALFGAARAVDELNSGFDDLDPELSADGREVIFVSDRSGNRSLWHARRSCQ